MEMQHHTGLWRKLFPFRVVGVYAVGVLTLIYVFSLMLDAYPNLPDWLTKKALPIAFANQLIGFLFVLAVSVKDLLIQFTPEGRFKKFFFKSRERQLEISEDFYKSGYRLVASFLVGIPILMIVFIFTFLKIGKLLEGVHVMDTIVNFFTI